MAEFHRLALTIALTEPVDVAAWADRVVAEEDDPELVFLELSCAGHSPAASVRTLLHDVPGVVNGDLAVNLLLGHASRLLASGTISEPELVRRLHSLAAAGSLPSALANELTWLEDALCLAQDECYGSVAEVASKVREFLAGYAEYGPVESDHPADEVPPSR